MLRVKKNFAENFIGDKEEQIFFVGKCVDRKFLSGN